MTQVGEMKYFHRYIKVMQSKTSVKTNGHTGKHTDKKNQQSSSDSMRNVDGGFGKWIYIGSIG
jgi:hypothetical protein